MRFLLSVLLISFLVVFFGCKTTTEDEPTVPSSPAKPLEEPEEEVRQEKPQTIIVPTGSLGKISEVRIRMLEKTLESKLDDYFAIVPKELFEEAKDKAFEELDYDECTEERCISKIQELLQVPNAFQLILLTEGNDTQISVTWNDLDQKRVEEVYCEGCSTKDLRVKIVEIVNQFMGINDNEISSQIISENQSNKIETKLLTVGDRGQIYLSKNGDLWNSIESGTILKLRDVIDINGIHIIVGDKGKILYSTNGLQWETNDFPFSKNFRGITYGNNKIIIVGEEGIILKSSNGINWEKIKSNIKTTLYDIAYGNNIFVAVGNNGQIITSSDGILWTKRNSKTNNYLWGINYLNNNFLITGGSGTILTSLNGISWSLRNAVNSNDLWDSSFGNGAYYVVGRNGTILKSENLLNWNQVFSLREDHLLGITFNNNKFYVVGLSGEISYSVDGNRWDKISPFNEYAFRSISSTLNF